MRNLTASSTRPHRVSSGCLPADPSIGAVATSGSTAVIVFAQQHDHARWGEDLDQQGGLTTVIASRLVRKLAGVAGVDVILFHDGATPDVRHAGARAQLLQHGRSFAHRVEDAVTRVLARGYERVVLVATDVPQLDACHVLDAAGKLAAGSGLVLGEDTTGGCYLIGLTRDSADVLKGVSWQEGTDFGRLCERGSSLPGRVSVLSQKLADVDEARQVAVLRWEAQAASIGKRLRALIAELPLDHDTVLPKVGWDEAHLRAAPTLSDATSPRGPPSH